MYPGLPGVELLDDHSSQSLGGPSRMPKRFPPEFRRKVLDLVTAGRRVAQVAADLDISEQTIGVVAMRDPFPRASSVPDPSIATDERPGRRLCEEHPARPLVVSGTTGCLSA